MKSDSDFYSGFDTSDSDGKGATSMKNRIHGGSGA